MKYFECTVSHPREWGPILTFFSFTEEGLKKKMQKIHPTWKKDRIIETNFYPEGDSKEYLEWYEKECIFIKRCCESDDYAA